MGSAGELASHLAATFAWWRDAGVDAGLNDAPRGWLAPPPGPPAHAPGTPGAAVGRPRDSAPDPAPELAFGGQRASWPTDLPAFAEWWLREPTLGVGEDRRRVAPRGPAGAALMVLVPQPEAEDRERLLSGPQGRLLAAIGHAVGLCDEQLYVASALPAHVGLVDWPALTEQDLAALTTHHVALAAPKRVLLFGRESASALLRNDPAHPSAPRPYFHHDPWQLEVACVASLESLLERPGRKAGVWETLLKWGV